MKRVERVLDLGRIVEVPERMRPDGEPAGVVDDRDRLLDRRRRAAAVAGRAGDEVGLEHLRGVGQALALEALGVRRVIEHGLRDVRAADRAVAGQRRRHVELEAVLAQRLDHPPRALAAVRAPGLERGEQVAVVVVEQVAADVEVLALAVERRDLGGRDDGDAVDVVGDVERLGDAVDRVVIGQREQLDAGRVGAADDVGRGERAVARGRVGLKVEGRSGGLRQGGASLWQRTGRGAAAVRALATRPRARAGS